jgi:hypothetical protein
VHRAVALSFLPPEPGKEYVQHIDGNRSNNDVTNLRWVSASDKNRRKKI